MARALEAWRMITLEDYLNHWRFHYGDVHVPSSSLTDRMRADAQTTVDRANALLSAFGKSRGITSGWRPVEVNRLVRGASPHSNHCKCLAIDIVDGDCALDAFCLASPHVLEELGLWQESPKSTPGWCHVQIVPFRSYKPGGARVFIP